MLRFRLVLATRTDPLLQLARLRTRDQLLDLHHAVGAGAPWHEIEYTVQQPKRGSDRSRCGAPYAAT